MGFLKMPPRLDEPPPVAAPPAAGSPMVPTPGTDVVPVSKGFDPPVPASEPKAGTLLLAGARDDAGPATAVGAPVAAPAPTDPGKLAAGTVVRVPEAGDPASADDAPSAELSPRTDAPPPKSPRDVGEAAGAVIP